MADKKDEQDLDNTGTTSFLVGDNMLAGLDFTNSKFKFTDAPKNTAKKADETIEEDPSNNLQPANEVKDEITHDEEDTDETETEVADENSETNEEQEVSPIKVFADILVGKGLADEFKPEDFEDSDEFLTKLYDNKLKKDLETEITAYKDSIPEALRELIDNYEEGVPLHELLKKEATISEYSSIKVEDLKEDEVKQKNIVKENLRRQGLSEEKAQAKVDRMETAGILSDEAEDALESLIKYEQKAKQDFIAQEKAAEQAEKQNYQNWLKSLDTTIKAKQEIVPGVKLTDSQRKQLYEAITKPVDRHPQTKAPITAFQKKQLEDPEYLIKVAYLANVLNWDFGALERSLTTKVVKKVTNTATTYKEPPSKMKGVDMSILKKIARS